jgi:flagellar motor switch protein FliN/FliY
MVVTAFDGVSLEISVVVGRTTMPVHQLLKMGRGAIIELDAGVDDFVWIYANNRLIARGEILVNGENVAVQVKETIGIPDLAVENAA